MTRPINDVAMPDEKPVLELIGTDGNAFSILGRTTRAARDAGWTGEQLEVFQHLATNGDYNHLLATVMDYFEVL